jgi:hypothetical protein
MKDVMDRFEDSILEFLKHILAMEDTDNTEDKDIRACDDIEVEIDDRNEVYLVNKKVVGKAEDN